MNSNIDQVTYAIMNLTDNTCKHVRIKFNKTVEPIIFLINFQKWTEENEFKYHFFSDILACFTRHELVNHDVFYEKLGSGLIVDDTPLGYDGKSNCAYFINTMIGQSSIKADLTADKIEDLHGFIINGELKIPTSYLSDEDHSSKLNSFVYMKYARKTLKDNPDFDLFSDKSRELSRRIKQFIENAPDTDEQRIEEIGITFIKKVKLTPQDFLSNLLNRNI